VPTVAGIDLVAYEDVRTSIRAHGDRWARRICTASELADCRVGSELSTARLAARFAAKEATLKVIPGSVELAIPWHAIEVHPHAGRALGLELRREAAAAAERGGLGALRLDLACAAEHAVAIVLGTSSAATASTIQTLPTQRSARKAPEPMNSPVTQEIRRVLDDHARLTVDAESLAPDADLYQAGMTSHASVNVMLALEDAFDVEFPDRLLKRSVFESVASIAAAIEDLRQEAA
jgi:phosphopantetheine--protein transferase-like protein